MAFALTYWSPCAEYSIPSRPNLPWPPLHGWIQYPFPPKSALTSPPWLNTVSLPAQIFPDLPSLAEYSIPSRSNLPWPPLPGWIQHPFPLKSALTSPPWLNTASLPAHICPDLPSLAEYSIPSRSNLPWPSLPGLGKLGRALHKLLSSPSQPERRPQTVLLSSYSYSIPRKAKSRKEPPPPPSTHPRPFARMFSLAPILARSKIEKLPPLHSDGGFPHSFSIVADYRVRPVSVHAKVTIETLIFRGI